MPLREWLLCFCLGLALRLAGGAPTPGEVPSFRRFTGREGLPQSQVCALLEDRRGFLWVGTYGGVARLGALGFQTFGGIPGLKGTRAVALLEAPDGAMWVAYQDGGLVRIEGNQVRIFGVRDGLAEVDSNALAWDARTNAVLVGTREGLYAGKDGRFQRLGLPSPWDRATVLALATDSQGGLWIGSRHGQLARWDGAALRMETLPPAFKNWSVEALAFDSQGRLWAMGTHGLALRDLQGVWRSVALTGVRGQVRLRGLQVTGKGEVVAGLGTDGIWMQPPDGPARLLGGSDGSLHEGVYAVLRDRGGRLWVGTNGGGLVVEGIPGLVNFRGGLGADLGDVLSILEFAPGDIFIGGGQGVFRWQDGKGFVGRWSVREGLPGPEIWTLQPDGAGGIWVGTDKGLAHWKDGRIRLAPPPLDTAVVQHVHRDGDGYWAGGDTGLLRVDLQGRVVASHALPPEADRPTVFSMIVTPRGVLVGSQQGVFRMQHGRFEKMWPEAPFATQRITELFEDRKGQVWVATTKGLYRQQGPGGPWGTLGRAEGLPDDLIYFIGDSGDGRVVVGHGKGVSLVGGGRMLNLNQNMGLISDETNQGGFLRDSRGRIWVGMIGGVSRMELARLPKEDPLPAPLLMEGAWGKAVATLPQALRLPPQTRSLDLRFDAGSPLVPLPPEFQVRLQGFEADWRTAEGGHVQYGQLPPGTYSLQARASTDSAVWAYAAPIEVRVAAAWYEHPLGRGLLVLGAVGLAWALVAWRIRRLEAAKQALEAKIQERTAALADSEQAAHAASRAKSAFLANMSHELRTPLNAILGFSQLMAREPGQSRQNQEHLGRILRAGEHLLGLINDVLSISKIESGRVALSLGAFDLRALLKGVHEMGEVRAQAKGLAFVMEGEAQLPAVVEGDEGKLRQVLLNLVGNAVKFTAHGTVTVRVAHAHGRARFEVEDTGPGIPEAELNQLFQAFQQTTTGRQQLEGTGLGLHICQAMVRLMGGEIHVCSEVGRGSSFAFEVPLPASGAEAMRRSRRKVLGLAEDQRPLTILVVDDRDENRVLLRHLFSLMGCTVLEAEDGLDGLNLWEQRAPDLVWLDIRMPRMDGFEMVSRLRAAEAERGLSRIPVIALTASAFDHDLAAMLAAGFDGQVVKPFRDEELFEAMERLAGVRFHREAEHEETAATPGAVDWAAVAAQPSAWRDALRQAARLGDAETAAELVGGLPPSPLAEGLMSLVKGYRFEELAEGLEDG